MFVKRSFFDEVSSTFTILMQDIVAVGTTAVADYALSKGPSREPNGISAAEGVAYTPLPFLYIHYTFLYNANYTSINYR